LENWASTEAISHGIAAKRDIDARFEQDVRNPLVTKLIQSTHLAADCYELDRAESPMEMSRMI
jgi:hypothetical protein